MLHPLPPHHPDALESDDSASFGGLADVLEPDPDAITSMRRLDVASVRHPSLRGHAAPPVSVRAPAPVQIEDFAFADTVVASELPDDAPPPSGPIFVNDEQGHTQCVTPLAFPLPPAAEHADLRTRLRVWTAHLRHAVRRSREEMRDLWAGTAEMVNGDGSQVARSGWTTLLRRAFALWSCFQWSRADLTRAALIGLAVFLMAAAAGAASIDLGPRAAASSEVRPGHTLEQHTGRKIAVHGKR
jgi:hypothetical protein